MKIGKPVMYEKKQYWIGAVYDAMVGLQRTKGDQDMKMISRNAIDPKATK